MSLTLVHLSVVLKDVVSSYVLVKQMRKHPDDFALFLHRHRSFLRNSGFSVVYLSDEALFSDMEDLCRGLLQHEINLEMINKISYILLASVLWPIYWFKIFTVYNVS